MDLAEIQRQVRERRYLYSVHADSERKAEGLTLAGIEDSILSGAILEVYPDTGCGEACLLLGFSDLLPIHVVCGWRGADIVIITVYIPRPPKWVDPWTRGGRA